MPEIKEWFGKWFDSPYYHVLYKNRDYDEARAFIDKLKEYFQFCPDDKILDLACGKGRHAIYLNQKGLDVVGLDLSEENIKYAKRFENARLHFQVHDMRELFAENTFDYVLNLFTSFGYFETKEENEKAVCAVARSLKDEGTFLIDFLNPYKVMHKLVPCEEKVIQGIKFKISKHLSEDDYIVKDIEFTDNGHSYHFQERVKAIRRVEFLRYFKKANLEVVQMFGDYQLNEYDCEVSDRMIFVLKNNRRG